MIMKLVKSAAAVAIALALWFALPVAKAEDEQPAITETLEIASETQTPEPALTRKPQGKRKSKRKPKATPDPGEQAEAEATARLDPEDTGDIPTPDDPAADVQDTSGGNATNPADAQGPAETPDAVEPTEDEPKEATPKPAKDEPPDVKLPVVRVRVQPSRADGTIRLGDTVTLIAESDDDLEGFVLQWQYAKQAPADKDTQWKDVPGETQARMDVTLSKKNRGYLWRIVFYVAGDDA